MDLRENVAIMSEIIVGPIKGYRNYMPSDPCAELKRMLMGGQIARKERIAMQRALIVKTWNELLHMTTAERMELRTERLFWMRQGMKLYGVAEQAVPKLRKGRRRSHSNDRVYCSSCDYWEGGEERRCFCEESQWFLRRVKPDDYCGRGQWWAGDS